MSTEEMKAERPETEVGREKDRLEKALVTLGKSIGDLRGRLKSVLRMTDEKGEEQAEPEIVPLADWIRAQCHSVQDFRSQIISMLERLEL